RAPHRLREPALRGDRRPARAGIRAPARRRRRPRPGRAARGRGRRPVPAPPRGGVPGGPGGLLSLPLGLLLARWLESILHAMPEIPENMHFFAFEPRTLAVHATLLAATAVLAALYPMR